MFFPNLPAALVKIRQLLTKNGRLSAAVWSAPSKVPLSELAFATVRKQLNIHDPQSGAPGPFALADVETLKQLFSHAGFNDIKIDALRTTFEFDSLRVTQERINKRTRPLTLCSQNIVTK